MKKVIPVLFASALIVTLGGILWWSTSKPKEPEPEEILPTVVSPTPVLTESQPTLSPGVPLLSETDIINLFFNLINEQRIPEAIGMMSPNLVPDDNIKQEWGVHFNAIESIRVQQIQPYGEETWTENQHTYQVTLEAQVSEKAANAPIPYYGWSGKPEARWITIEKNQDWEWQIGAIATGP